MNSLPFYALCIAMCCGLGLFSVMYRKGRFTRIIVVAFVARLVFAAVFPEIVGVEDIADYKPYFVDFVNALESGTVLSFLSEGVPVYTVIFPGWAFAALGPDSYFLIRLFNAILSVCVIIPLNVITEEVWNRELKRWQLLMVLFWPSYLVLSVDVGRTAFGVVLPLTTVAFALKYFQNTENTAILTAAVIFSILNAANRIHYLFYLIMFLIGIYAYKSLYQSSKRVGAAILVLSGVFGGGVAYIYNRFFISVLSVETIRQYAKSQATGGSVYLPGLYPSTVLDLFWYLPIQGFYFLFSPMVWDIHRIGNILAVVAGMESMLLLVLVSAALWRGLDEVTNDWRIFALLVAVVLTAVGFGAVTKNAGAAVRWRLPSTLLLLVVTTNILHERINSTTVKSSKNRGAI